MAGLFDTKIAHPTYAKNISIESVPAFIRSIQWARQTGYNQDKRKALILAQNRAKANINNIRLSPQVRMRYSQIAQINIPEK